MSSPSSAPSSTRVLEPSERIAEGLFGCIMALTLAGHEDVHTMFIAQTPH
jgi:hypothetical protein